MRHLLSLLSIVLICACSPNEKKTKYSVGTPMDSMEVHYASGFAVNYFQDYKELLVFSSDRTDTLHRYYLSNKGKEACIETPVKRLASLSSVYAAYIEELGIEKSLVAIDEKNYINSKTILQEFENGGIVELGSLDKLNHEVLLMSQPDMIYSFGWQGTNTGLENKYSDIHFVYAYEYLEQHPLGRAEWIKFFACFFDMEIQADSIFNQIKANYESLKNRTQKVESRPKILINMPFKEQWYMPGGLSYSAHFIADAGAYYPWDTLMKMNSSPLDWELVYNKAFDSDFWINTGAYSSYTEVENELPDMNLFDAFKNKKAYNNNARVNTFGGNDYWESGLLHVDEILADLIAIFHPEILPNRNLKYYKTLEDE